MGHAQRARGFVANAERSRWHDGALWHVRHKRDVAVAEVEEWEELRERASEIRAHCIDHIADYLARFETRAVEHGAVVHFARDAAELNRIVHGLLQSRGAKSVVKSKSMLTEECALNPYLEKRGIQVTDTDLGEFIVQLRRERPSHIVLPAIHLKREDVGRTFQDELGRATSDDPAVLTEYARQHMRQRFLEADAAITGVNFAVAETGSVVVCSNEGNADLGMALTPLLIAAMGIEKLVARAEDLGVFLRLLARSATGQAITAYTSHLQGPRQGQELHIVVLDNGRSRILADARHRNVLKCIRCGACLNTCPIFRRSGGHSYGTEVPGPIGSILAPLRQPERHASLPHACSLCGSCTLICPVGVDLQPQLLDLRSRLKAPQSLTLPQRFAAQLGALVLARPRLFGFVGGVLRFLASRVSAGTRNRLARRLTAGRDLPRFPQKAFHQRYQEHLAEMHKRGAS